MGLSPGRGEQDAKQRAQVARRRRDLLTITTRARLAATGLRDEDVRKAVRVLREGLNAKQTKAFVSEGVVIYSRPLIDYTERRMNAAELLALADLYPRQEGIDITADQVTFVVRGLDGDKV